MGTRGLLQAALLLMLSLAGLQGASCAPAEPATPRCIEPPARPPAQPKRVLIIGNSFVQTQLAKMLSELTRASSVPYVFHESTRGGATLSDHAAALESPTSELARQLARARSWDAVILQAQSQLLGFSPDEPATRAERAAAGKLVAAARGVHARAWLMETWGYARGDPMNPQLYPDFPRMQERLSAGVSDLARQLSRAGDVPVLPVGRAFARVYEVERERGVDPTQPDSLFRKLFAPDLKHPSVLGSYLSACVVAARLMGSCESTSFVTGVRGEDLERLRQLAVP